MIVLEQTIENINKLRALNDFFVVVLLVMRYESMLSCLVPSMWFSNLALLSMLAWEAL
jgi:hypothetical protein